MYYNTTNIDGEELNKSRRSEQSQTARILAFFISHPGRSFTPADIHKAMGETFLLTSVRRSMSDLTKSEDLIKTSEKSAGKFGSVNYKWTLNTKVHKPPTPPDKQLSFFK